MKYINPYTDLGFKWLEKGKELGCEEGTLQMLINLVRKGLLSLQDAVAQAGIS